MALEAASRVAAALGMLAAGALLRAGGIIGEAEVQASLWTKETMRKENSNSIEIENSLNLDDNNNKKKTRQKKKKKQAGSTIANYLTLPCLALRVFSGTTATAGGPVPPLPPLPLLAAAAATALLSALLAVLAGTLVVFSGRRRPERALLTAAAVGSGGGLFTGSSSGGGSAASLSPAGAYGHALALSLAAAGGGGDGDAALPLALAWCLADAAASLASSRVLLGSWGGKAFPATYEHADGGV